MIGTESESRCQENSNVSSCSPPTKKSKPNVWRENVVIKVEGKLYHLNSIQLALKSNYFEKLFVENWAEKNSDVIEIRSMSSDTFSAIVDLMNGKNLKSVMNRNNYLALLMGMDYLQMEINLEAVERYIVERYREYEFVRPVDIKVIELCNFITVNQNYRYLESSVLKYISAHLIEIVEYDEKFVFSLLLEQFLKIIREEVVMWCEFSGERSPQAKQSLSEICSKWICHDVENRLQHFTAIAHSANYGFYSKFFSIPSEKVKSLLDEIKNHTSQEQIEKSFQHILSLFGGNKSAVGRIKRGETSFRETRIVNKMDEKKQLSRFINEGRLSDVTIKAGAKTYRLHRSILATASIHFPNPSCSSSENSEFVVDIDEKNFDLILNFIYFHKIPKFNSNSKTNVIQLLKAAAIFKSNLVIEKCCVPWMEKFLMELTIDDIIEISDSAVSNNLKSASWFINVLRNYCIFRLTKSSICKEIFQLWQIYETAGIENSSSFDFRRRTMSVIDEMNNYEDLLRAFDVICEVNDAGKYSNLYIACLCKLIAAPRSELSIESHFLSISCDTLNELLASEYFIISDPQKILDICSKWIVHDVENRYRLLPRIVFAINRNNSMDCSDFEANIPAELSRCSQQVVNEELWKLLKSNCLLSRDLASEKTIRDFKTRPLFILPKNFDMKTCIPREVRVVDIELNEIASLDFLSNHYGVRVIGERCCMEIPKLSAAMIYENLFVLCEVGDKFQVYSYNFSSKKVNVLVSVPRMMHCTMNTLLNCNNQLIWCFDDDRMMKYSFELNRWLEIYSDSEIRNQGPYGSDGKKLFRCNNNALQIFDFEQSSWTHFVDLPPYSRSSSTLPFRLTNFHNGIALLYTSSLKITMLLYDLNTRLWETISSRNHSLYCSAELIPYGEELLCVCENGIRQLLRTYGSVSRWQLKKPATDFGFRNIVSVHMPCISPQSNID